jgi:hypothetical protein
VDGHGSTLGKTEQNCFFQCWFTTMKLKKSLLKLAHSRGYGVPISGEQSVPLTPTPLGVKLRRIEGHQIKQSAHTGVQSLPQGSQVVTIGSPSVQQHQSSGHGDMFTAA